MDWIVATLFPYLSAYHHSSGAFYAVSLSAYRQFIFSNQGDSLDYLTLLSS